MILLLYVGFEMEIMLIIQWFLVIGEQNSCWVKDFSASQAALPGKSLGVYKKLGGDTAKTQTDQRNIPYQMTK